MPRGGHRRGAGRPQKAAQQVGGPSAVVRQSRAAGESRHTPQRTRRFEGCAVVEEVTVRPMTPDDLREAMWGARPWHRIS
jgi:hypothetical protein